MEIRDPSTSTAKPGDSIVQCFATLAQDAPKWIEDLTVLEGKAQNKRSVLKDTSGSVQSVSVQVTSPVSNISRLLGFVTGISIKKRKKITGRSSFICLLSIKRASAWPAPTTCTAPQQLLTWKRYSDDFYYDGEPQKMFERVVSDMTTSRALLRRAKLQAMIAEKAGSPASLHSQRQRSELDVRSSSKSNLEAINDIDKTLEQAQMACEKAAFRFLRDGRCTKEIAAAKADLNKVIGAAQKQVIEAARELVAEQQAGPTQDQSVEPRVSSSSSEPRSLANSSSFDPKRSSSHSAPLKDSVVDLEVDETEDAPEKDEDVFDIRQHSKRLATMRLQRV